MDIKIRIPDYSGYDFFADYKKELGWYNPLFCDYSFEECVIYARHGDARYMDFLAFAYLNGVGVEVDGDKAVYWYSLAAEKDDTEALCALAKICSDEKDKNFNPANAFALYNRAAEAGSSEGQFNAGLCCLNGFGAEKDFDRAVEFIKAAADNHSREAKKLLEELKVKND